MTEPVQFALNRACEAEIAGHLMRCDAGFVPPLSERVKIGVYAGKIAAAAVRFEAWSEGVLVGLVAAYCNDGETATAYITSVSVLPGWIGRGLATQLVAQCVTHARQTGFSCIELKVDRDNARAIKLYEKSGFAVGRRNGRDVTMRMETGKEVQMSEQPSKQRDYNDEVKDTAERQYAYDFDFDVMHPFMIRSFEPFFKRGNLLELGSFQGDFTKRLLPYFDDVTCVEASDAAIDEARRTVGDRVRLVHSTFEAASLPTRYDNVVLTHVLEHLDDPVLVLKRINSEWLAEGGRLFLVCPNANAPSRQIAVKMGLITHNAAVTPGEAAHGHRLTYSLDTLERDAVAAGLKVVHRSGIFFKALANFQWDRLLQTDIISDAYLEGCYQLGQHYPDLCASIFLLCERGEKK